MMKKLFFSLLALVATVAFAGASYVSLASEDNAAVAPAAEPAADWELVKSLDYATSTWQGWNFNSATHSFVDGTLQVTNATATSQNYELQYHGADGFEVEEGATYQLRITMKGKPNGTIFAAVCDWGHNGQNGANLNFTAENQTLVSEFTSDFTANCFVMLQSGLYVGTYNIAKIELYKKIVPVDPDVVYDWVDVTAEEHVVKTFENQFSNQSGAITVVSQAKQSQDWDTQIWFVMDEPLQGKTKLKLTVDAKASSAQSLGVGAHGAPDGNNWKAGGVCNGIDVTTEWQTFEREFTAQAGWQSFALDLTKAAEVTYEFKNIKIEAWQEIEVTPLVAGDYLLKNVATGTYLNGANAWGTKASVTTHGQFFTLAELEDGTYTLDSHISNGGANHFLGSNGFVDAAAAPFAITCVGDGVWTIKSGDNYLATNANNTEANFDATEVTEAAQWVFVSKDDLYASLAAATVGTTVDATALIGDADFSRNNQYFDQWQGDKPGKGGPDNPAGVRGKNAEKWGGNSQEFDSYQILNNLPNGTYILKVQGYYRYNNTPDNTNDIAAATHADGTEKINSYFYANDVEMPLTSIADEASLELCGTMPFSQGDAATAFGKGAYQNELTVEVTDGTLKLGVKKIAHEGCDWTVWDNFELYYAPVPEMVVVPAFICGDEEITLNDHSIVSVEKAEALKVNFENGVNVIGATYSVKEMLMGQDDEGTFWHDGAEVAVGELSVNSIGYCEFDAPIKFEYGKKYKLSVTAFRNPVDPTEIGTYTYEFNGAFVSVTLAAGDYVIKNVATGTYLNGANAWGTKASVTKHGQFFTVAELEDGAYNLDSHISNGGANHFLGSNGYVDAGAANLVVESADNGAFTIKSGDNYLATNANNTEANFDATEATEAAQWVFLSKDDILAEMANATAAAPVDVTAFIGDANFSRNNQYKSLWSMEASNKNLGGGANENMCAESFHSAFTLSQTLENLPNGLYKVYVQGYYRQDGEDTNLPYFFANDATAEFMNVETLGTPAADDNHTVQRGDVFIPNSMGHASNIFAAGEFVHELDVVVNDGTLTLGAKNENLTLWVIWDNFELYYLGEPEAPAEMTVTPSLFAGFEDLEAAYAGELGTEYTLNTHSLVSVDVAEGLHVEVANCPEAVGISFMLNEMNMGQDEEGTFWTVGKEIAVGEINMQRDSYAAFEAPITFYSGTKYQLTVTVFAEVNGEPAEISTTTYQFNGSSAPVNGSVVDGINSVEMNSVNGKFIKNGKVVIVKNGKTYNVNGVLVK